MNKLLSYIINTSSEGYMNIVATHIMITIAVSYSVFTIKPPFLKGLTEPRASKPPPPLAWNCMSHFRQLCKVKCKSGKSNNKHHAMYRENADCMHAYSIPKNVQNTILPHYTPTIPVIDGFFLNLNTSHILFHVTLYQTFNNHKPNKFIDM